MGETTGDEMAEASEVERDDEVLRILSCFKLNPFEFLNLPFDSSLEDVENQFRKLSLLVHPDNCKHPQAKEAFGALAKAQQLLMDPQERDYILSQVKEAKEELLFQHKNQLKIDTASKPMSLVDETFESKYEQSEEFQHQLRLKVKELLKQEEWSRTMAKQVHVQEPRPRKEEEVEKEMRKRKREHEEQWEGTREKREIVGAKKSPLLLRMILLVAVMMCGIYICSVGLKQISSGNTSLLTSVQVSSKPCTMPSIDESEKHLFHFPKPSTYSRAECACNPVRYFAILSTQRSGSGWFETLLNSHRNVSSNGEIFSVKVRRTNVTTIIETLDKVYNLDWLSSASKNECTAAVGLKWMLNQGLMKNHQEIVKYFTSRGVSVIFLFRRNLLRRMVSILANTYDRDVKLLNGTHKSHVHSPLEAEILANYKPKVNATKLIGDLKQVDDMVKKALEYFDSTRHMLVYYEDVLKNRTKLLDVQDFLKIPRMKLTSRQVKIHKGPLSEQVANWDEVLKTLNGTQYESFIRSDYKV